jgi:hypothetical protein
VDKLEHRTKKDERAMKTHFLKSRVRDKLEKENESKHIKDTHSLESVKG